MKSSPGILSQSTDTEQSCVGILKVLADETRLAVIEALLDGPKTVAEINERLGVEPTLLSHHLRALRDAGLVTRERHGRHASYALESARRASRTGRAIDLGCCTLSFS